MVLFKAHYEGREITNNKYCYLSKEISLPTLMTGSSSLFLKKLGTTRKP